MEKTSLFMREKRKRMIEVIRLEYGLDSSKVLRILGEIPREEFVDKSYWDVSYDDRPVPIGFNQTMSQPYTVAFMTQLLIQKLGKRGNNGKTKVLEIGTGSGYQSAVLSKLFDKVYTLEIIPQLAFKARKTLKKLGYKNVYVSVRSGELGWKEKSPFNAIIITADIKGELPKKLLQQLKVGGALVAPINGEMMRYIKTKKGFKSETFGQFSFVPFVKQSYSES